MFELVSVLKDQIEVIPGTKAELTTFPSGSAMLHVRVGERLYVLSYSPDRQFEVDEVDDDDAFEITSRFLCAEFEAAAARLRELIAQTNAANPPLTVVGAK